MACGCCGGSGRFGMLAVLVAVGAVVLVAGATGAGAGDKTTEKTTKKNTDGPVLSPTPGNDPGTRTKGDGDAGKARARAPGGHTGNVPGEKSAKDNAADKAHGNPTMASSDEHDVLGFKVNRIDGTPENLEIYRGRVVLIVNTASQCGYTPQYTGLERLYREKKDRGFVVLGFPADNFGGQEPGTNEEIARFCSGKYNVTFPMFEKISVAGADAHPLYKKLAEAAGALGGEPKWNFTKYLVDRAGRVAGRYDSKIKPDDPQLTARIDELLGETN